MSSKIEGKYAVITGASSGIGYETAIKMAELGKNVVIAARRRQELEALKELIRSLYPTVEVVVREVDLSVNSNVYQFYNEIKELGIDTLINNAGFGYHSTVAEQNVERTLAMIRLNIEALTILSTLFTRDHAQVEGAQLINVSSVGGYNVINEFVTYCSTKFFVSAFTEGLAQELMLQNAKLKAKVLAPAATETEFANVARSQAGFSYKASLPRYHTSKEMANFLMDLYKSNAVVGIVDPVSFEFSLRDPIFRFGNTRAR